MQAYLESVYAEDLQRAELRDPEMITLVDDENGELVAFAQVRSDGDAMEIWRFYVDAPHHGRGLAQRLMQAVEALARERGTKRLWLGVWEHNARAIRFYEKCGFRRTGSKPFLVGSDLQTDNVMERRVDE